MDSATQDEIVDFLAHELGGTPSIRTTHISTVVLGESRVYKLKRNVVFPYLDFSTPEKRLAMCEREVALNRRLAPALYLGARRVTREFWRRAGSRRRGRTSRRRRGDAPLR